MRSMTEEDYDIDHKTSHQVNLVKEKAYLTLRG